MAYSSTKIQVLCAILLACACTSAAEGTEFDKGKRRARPPEWPAGVRDVFFEDARTKLVGERPKPAKNTSVAASAADSSSVPDTASANAASGAWSKLIDAATIETEVKRISQSLAADVKNPSAFKGSAYKDCRRHFTVLATLMAIAAEYDDDVRWKDSAATLRDRFARAGHNCKVGTDQTFQESSLRRQELAELISGTRPPRSPAEPTANWPEVADRPPLMERLNIAHEVQLTKWVANAREFSQHRERIVHEAQLVAAIADVIARESYEYWDDEQFSQYSDDLRQGAVDAATAAEADNYEAAKRAVSQMTKACANCHEGYRG